MTEHQLMFGKTIRDIGNAYQKTFQHRVIPVFIDSCCRVAISHVA
jgi:hypothetical protein